MDDGHESDLDQAKIDALIFLFSSGQIEDAILKADELIQKYPQESKIYNIKGACLAAVGESKLAITSYKKSIDISPEYAEAHNNLGITFQHIEEFDKAVLCFEKVLTLSPDSIDAFNILCNAIKELNQPSKALESFKRIINIKPNLAEAHFNLGVALQEAGELEDSVTSYEQVINLNPNFVEAYYNLGIIMQELNRKHESFGVFEKALMIDSENLNVLNNLGTLFSETGQFDKAIINFEKVINIDPDNISALNNLGITHGKTGQLDDAVTYFDKALNIDPHDTNILNNLGITYADFNQEGDAVRSYEKAIKVKPDDVEAYVNLGESLGLLKQKKSALKHFEKAFSLEPETELLLGKILNTKMALCNWNELTINLEILANKINSDKKVITPFSLLALIDDPVLQLTNAKIYAREFPQDLTLPKIKTYENHTKIRIGYFSADFHNHPTMHLIAELFEKHDKSKFELIAFSFGPDSNDEWRKRAVSSFNEFIDVRFKSDLDIALMAREMEIDIAVNLGGYTQSSRTEIFAKLAAPIQVSYLGFPGTMALDYIDYLIADYTLIPLNMQKHYSEKIVYMPDSYQVNISDRDFSNKVITRAQHGLPEKAFVFCCFNNNHKITPYTFNSWMRILKQVKGSVLWLFENTEDMVENISIEAEKFGIDRNRLVFAKYMHVEDHLNRLKCADIFLDTLPYNAHTTTSDALRMRLPVLTLIGNSFASRVAASLLNAVNLPELITTSQEQYESFAINLALNPKKLTAIREKLDNNLASAPLFNSLSFTQNLEKGFEEMLQRYKSGLKPDHLYLKEEHSLK